MRHGEEAHRSGCPINLTLEILGDKWSLLILRDMIFGGKRHFRELLGGSQEKIASNILADRLKRLMEQGLLTRAEDPTHKRKASYSLTEMGRRGGAGLFRDRSVGPPLSAGFGRTQHPRRNPGEGGRKLWTRFMDELREKHLGTKPRRPPGRKGVSVRGELRAAYEGVMAKRAKATGRAA